MPSIVETYYSRDICNEGRSVVYALYAHTLDTPLSTDNTLGELYYYIDKDISVVYKYTVKTAWYKFELSVFIK